VVNNTVEVLSRWSAPQKYASIAGQPSGKQASPTIQAMFSVGSVQSLYNDSLLLVVIQLAAGGWRWEIAAVRSQSVKI
jgi:hypothetical protein